MKSPPTIFIPTRNGGALLRDAIASVLAQSHADWRLVILENASADGTTDMLAGLDDPRIRVLAEPTPLGIHGNWARVSAVIERQPIPDDTLVTILGHDDLLRPDFLATIVALAAAHPDATLYQTHFDLIDASGRTIRPCRPIASRETGEDLAAALLWGLRDSFGTGYVFRAGDLRAVGGVPDLPMLLYADHLLFMRLARRGYKATDAAAAFRYRLHAGSASGGLNRAKVEAQALALQQFVGHLRGEWAGFLNADRGRAAFASLLARETSYLGTPALQPLLSRQAGVVVSELTDLLTAYAGDWSPAILAGPPIAGSALLLRLRRWSITAAAWRLRWRGA